VHPGVLVADVGHFEQILVQARLADGLLKQRLVGARRARGHHHAVDLLLLDDLLDVVLVVLRAGEQVVFHMHHVRQGAGVVAHRRHIGHAADIDAAVAHEHTDAHRLSAHIGFGRQFAVWVMDQRAIASFQWRRPRRPKPP
jgi:hypothetical protein